MRKDTLIFVDREEEYLRSMSEFLGSRKDFPMVIRAYSDVLKMICEEDPLVREREEDPNPPYVMVLVAESAYMEDIERIAPGNVVLLQETDIDHPDQICIDKYRNAEKVMQDIIRFYADSSSGLNRCPGRSEEVTIQGFFSPDDICGKNCLAYAEALQSAKDRSTLLLDMEMYLSAESVKIADSEGHDISDLLYFVGEKRDKFRYHLKSLLTSMGGCDVVPRMRLGLGIPEVSKEDWLMLLSKIEEADDHEVVILNLSAGMRGLPEIMRRCDSIIVPGSKANMSVAMEGFIGNLMEMGYEDVISKLVFGCSDNGKAFA